jgi:hypothetical protein
MKFVSFAERISDGDEMWVLCRVCWALPVLGFVLLLVPMHFRNEAWGHLWQWHMNMHEVVVLIHATGLM